MVWPGWWPTAGDCVWRGELLVLFVMSWFSEWGVLALSDKQAEEGKYQLTAFFFSCWEELDVTNRLPQLPGTTVNWGKTLRQSITARHFRSLIFMVSIYLLSCFSVPDIRHQTRLDQISAESCSTGTKLHASVIGANIGVCRNHGIRRWKQRPKQQRSDRLAKLYFNRVELHCHVSLDPNHPSYHN